MQDSSKNLLYLKIFLIVVIVISFLSLSYRLILSFVNSTFQYGTFNLLMVGKSSHLIHLDHDFGRMSIVKIGERKGRLQDKSRLAQSIKLGLPVDGSIIASSDNSLVEGNNFSYMEALRMIFSGNDYKLEDVNWVDVLKVSYYSQVIDKNDISNVEIDSLSLDLTANRFIDTDIYNEKQSVQVINSTGIDGLALDVSTVLKNMGYNVVSLINGKDKKSVIEAGNVNTVSVKRLQKLFEIPIVKSSRSQVSDITVVLGEDLRKELTAGR